MFGVSVFVHCASYPRRFEDAGIVPDVPGARPLERLLIL